MRKYTKKITMKKAFFIILLLNYSFLFSQNKVVNGDFEIYDTCPNSFSFPGNVQINRCNSWITPTFATSDYFNTCANGTSVGVPINTFGYQNASSGDAYTGLIPIAQSNGWVEYIQGQIEPLEVNEYYKLSLKLNLSNNSFFAIQKLGIHISDIQITNFSTTGILHSIDPQFETPDSVYISDTLNWMYFEWTFIANGTEKYIIIGNFNDVPLSSAISVNHDGNMDSYIFIDEVKIEKTDLSFLTIPNIITPNNDNLNDFWEFPLKSAGILEITIINRWGNIIRKEELENFKWDGKDSKGKNCEEGVYFYVIKTKYNDFKGHINIF